MRRGGRNNRKRSFKTNCFLGPFGDTCDLVNAQKLIEDKKTQLAGGRSSRSVRCCKKCAGK